jgi:hypothetical protein
MTRFDRDFEGIPASAVLTEGLDPNYRGGYRGMRMTASSGQAAYGAHRLSHIRDLETAGGFGGIHGPNELDDGGSLLPPGGHTGGVRPFSDAEMMRDFDSRGERYATDRYGPHPQESRAPSDSEGVEDWTLARPHEPDYGNRGMPPAGFSESWARGPMPGSR